MISDRNASSSGKPWILLRCGSINESDTRSELRESLDRMKRKEGLYLHQDVVQSFQDFVRRSDRWVGCFFGQGGVSDLYTASSRSQMKSAHPILRTSPSSYSFYPLALPLARQPGPYRLNKARERRDVPPWPYQPTPSIPLSARTLSRNPRCILPLGPQSRYP